MSADGKSNLHDEGLTLEIAIYCCPLCGRARTHRQTLFYGDGPRPAEVVGCYDCLRALPARLVSLERRVAELEARLTNGAS